jgi:hypothetical protein
MDMQQYRERLERHFPDLVAIYVHTHRLEWRREHQPTVTPQAAFDECRHAQIATAIGHAHRKPTEWMHEMAWHLWETDGQRIRAKGKPMSDDHLKQVAVKAAKRDGAGR